MTGSIHRFNRQYSSTATTNSTKEEVHQPKLRRCSSADEHNSPEFIPEVHFQKEKFSFKRGSPTSDIDSGTEEVEQQSEHVFLPAPSDNEDPIPQLDEGFSESDREEDPQLAMIKRDLEMAQMIIDETKKDFCADTCVAFHGEFARLISYPISLHYGIRYFLFAEEEIDPMFFANIPFDCRKVDNAKAQFKCSNVHCQHAWTSMRARILFYITAPHIGFIALKILGQDCQLCGANADALWYIDEVCRVMKNLAYSFFERYLPDMLNVVDLTISQPIEEPIKPIRHLNHDRSQRKGKMFAPHRSEFCEACRLGVCFA